jgi:hypothetical protein
MIEIIKNIKNKLYFVFNKIIIYSFTKLNIFEKQDSINNIQKKNTRIIKKINYDNNEEMYGQFIYFD